MPVTFLWKIGTKAGKAISSKFTQELTERKLFGLGYEYLNVGKVKNVIHSSSNKEELVNIKQYLVEHSRGINFETTPLVKLIDLKLIDLEYAHTGNSLLKLTHYAHHDMPLSDVKKFIQQAIQQNDIETTLKLKNYFSYLYHQTHNPLYFENIKQLNNINTVQTMVKHGKFQTYDQSIIKFEYFYDQTGNPVYQKVADDLIKDRHYFEEVKKINIDEIPESEILKSITFSLDDLLSFLDNSLDFFI